MKKILKLTVYIVTFIFIFIFGINNLVYGVGRFVDIPVPPNSSGHTDVTSEEAEQKEKEYEENQENTNIININVINENVNLTVDTIKIENQDENSIQENDEELISKIDDNNKSKDNSNIIVLSTIAGVVVIGGILIVRIICKKC